MHRKGTVADCLLHAPMDKPKKEDLVNGITLHPVGDARIKEIRLATSVDCELQNLKRLLLQGWSDDIKDVPYFIKPYVHHRDETATYQEKPQCYNLVQVQRSRFVLEKQWVKKFAK
ncbi:hypothetical protein CAPTEDRAFT_197947 [Capitella teleta]|uniref:Uncharacterized protein n=1 Tax=Capitella teleta TaxID=283909 RepID=R7UE47_CAPTE|nr:hypothetical protein CAPTEDRAFT_197947 [Capitella teleta]|eukprot:ELU01527.1 hypothetical protein CAPTEDRAFT_197947 [Capitella teleta]